MSGMAIKIFLVNSIPFVVKRKAKISKLMTIKMTTRLKILQASHVVDLLLLPGRIRVQGIGIFTLNLLATMVAK